jgi:hypothetical protein
MASWLKEGWIVTQDPEEVVRILLDEAVPVLPIVSRDQIEAHAKVLGERAPYQSGTKQEVEPLLRSYLTHLKAGPDYQGFEKFRIETDTFNTRGLECAIVYADFKPFSTPLPIWREAPDTLVFPITGISAASRSSKLKP